MVLKEGEEKKNKKIISQVESFAQTAPKPHSDNVWQWQSREMCTACWLAVETDAADK